MRDCRADPDRVYVTGLSYGGFCAWHIAAAKLPIWVFSGGRDTVVRTEWVLESVVALEKAGHPDVRFTVHEDLPHDVWTRVCEGWDLYNWLLQHRRAR